MLAPNTLRIANFGQSSVFRLHEEARCRSMQQRQLLTKPHGTFFRQRLNQVFQQGAQAPGDLNACPAEVTDFRDGQLDEVLPVRGPVDEPEPACLVSHSLVVQTSLTHVPKEVVDLVQGENSRGRVVDRWRKPLGGDVHDNPNGKSRVLLQSPFLAHGDRLVKGIGRESYSTVENAK